MITGHQVLDVRKHKTHSLSACSRPPIIIARFMPSMFPSTILWRANYCRLHSTSPSSTQRTHQLVSPNPPFHHVYGEWIDACVCFVQFRPCGSLTQIDTTYRRRTVRVVQTSRSTRTLHGDHARCLPCHLPARTLLIKPRRQKVS
jgi:hypothetical protein